MKKTCSVDGCERDVKGRGYCNLHYLRKHRDGEFGTAKCKVDGCEKTMVGKGLCQRHWDQNKRHGRIFERTVYDPNEFVTEGQIIKIFLYDQSGNKCGESIIDKEDYDIIKNYKWCLLKHGNYCVTRINKKLVFLQNMLMGKQKLDHKNRNGLDNRRSNLRPCTHQQNIFNIGIRSDNTSGFKGVFKDRKKWNAKIGKNGDYHNLGYFNTKEKAAVAYNEAAKKLFGEFAYLNQVQS